MALGGGGFLWPQYGRPAWEEFSEEVKLQWWEDAMHATRYTMTDRPRYLSVCPSCNLLFSHISLEYHSETFLVTQTGRVGRGGGGEGGFQFHLLVSDIWQLLSQNTAAAAPTVGRTRTHTHNQRKEKGLPSSPDFWLLFPIFNSRAFSHLFCFDLFAALFLLYSALIGLFAALFLLDAMLCFVC